jgi:hypothetical protein
MSRRERNWSPELELSDLRTSSSVQPQKIQIVRACHRVVVLPELPSVPQIRRADLKKLVQSNRTG